MNHKSAIEALFYACRDEAWPTLKKNAQGRFNYADLPHILDVHKRILDKYFLKIIFKPIVDRSLGMEIMRTILIHIPTGDEIIAESIIRAGDSDQKWGGSHTYQKRYGILAILGISAGDIDPDELIGMEEIKQLQTAIKSHITPPKVLHAFLIHGKIDKIEQLKYEFFKEALDFITTWKG